MQPTTFTPAQLTPWLTALKAGEVCAAPAEGVYGYVANPFNLTSLQALLTAKNRAPTKGYIVLIENLHQLPLFCPTLPDTCIAAIQTYWQPGQPPTTLILPALSSLPTLLTGGLPTIALRCPQLPYIAQYLRAADTPLVSTSLNISGQPPATAHTQIPTNLPALILPQPLSGKPSRIFNPLADTWLR